MKDMTSRPDETRITSYGGDDVDEDLSDGTVDDFKAFDGSESGF
jgi:hypothetical protein